MIKVTLLSVKRSNIIVNRMSSQPCTYACARGSGTGG